MNENGQNSVSGGDKSLLSDLDVSSLGDESFLRLLDEPFDTNVNVSRLRADAKFNGFDPSTGNSWIYPTNYQVRQYQYNISRASLFKNTLVVLPTGLGKTFIAAVVMYNIFRWYPKGKIIFMAPTRPLVAQQIDACYQIMGIPKDETAELTGKQMKKKRAIEWKTKRVFYATPQVVWSDLNDPEINFPLNDVKLLVIDEAHKARGKYAYVEVVQSMAARNKAFRVLALSATPGRDIKDVIEVVQNLLISHIEVRWESCIDVAPYVFKKNIKTKVVPLGDFLGKVRNEFHQLIDPYVRNLIQQQVTQGHSGNLSKGWLILDQKRFRESAANRHPEHSSIMSDFSMCISLYHALELLERHGIRVFLNHFNDDTKNFVFKDVKVRRFVDELREQMGANPFPENDASFYGNVSIDDHVGPIDYGHPKFDILRECVVEHFQNYPDSKVIIFCEYRESVFLINRMLIEESPRVKPKVFVGQGSSHARTITQKEQIAIMKDFKAGVCNTLIATCVAEEGIDVGEVDLIVCFDVNNKNPTRYIQRIGRTGRKRQGKVFMLVSEGKEHAILQNVMSTKDGTNQKISKSNEVTKALYRNPPRMVPPEFHPQCIETYIKIDDEQTTAMESSTVREQARVAEPSTSKAKKAKTKPNKRVQPSRGSKQPDIRQALVKRVEIDDEILRDFDLTDVFNTSTLSHGFHDETMRDPCESTETSIQPVAAVVSTKEKFMKICERYREIKKCSNGETNPLDAAAVINNTRLANPLKVLWLKNNLKFVQEHYTHRKTSRLYSSIAKIIGGDRSVQRMLAKPTEQWSDMKPMRQMSIFQMLNLVDRETKENVPVNDTEPSQAAALTFESQLSFGFVESKYASQFETQIPMTVPPLPSLHNETISSSTPKRINKTAANDVQPPIDSPIRMTTSSERRRLKSRKEIPETVPHHLRFLGLSSIDDLFFDSDDEYDPNPNEMIKEKTDANSNHIPVNAMDDSDLFADESMSFSKSRSALSHTATTTTNTTTATTTTIHRVNRLNIGSISDLFRDDDSDDDENVVVDSKDDTVAKTDSDDTEEYDFGEIISIMEVAEKAVNRSLNTSQKENHNENQAKAVVQHKSDDLFATYNETIETNANRSSANETNASKFSVPTPPKPRDKGKHSGVSTDSNGQLSPSNRLNYAIIQDKSPSMLNRSSVSRSNSGASSKSLLSKFNATAQSSDTHSDDNHSLRFGIPSTSNQPKRLNFTRLKANAVASMDNNMSDEIGPSQFLTCRVATTTSGQSAVTVDKSHIDQMNMNISTESETPDEDEIFATCQMAKPAQPQRAPLQLQRKSFPRKEKRKKKICAFIDDEAAVSGDDSSDEDMDDFMTQQLEQTVDLEEGDPSVDMQAKYLQSVRSPAHARLRIPPIGYRNPNATANIFSQYVAPDVSSFMADSFVVTDDEEVIDGGDDDDDDDDDGESEMSELERAEMILKEKRRQKRKLKQNGKFSDGGTTKRRRIMVLDSDSD